MFNLDHTPNPGWVTFTVLVGQLQRFTWVNFAGLGILLGKWFWPTKKQDSLSPGIQEESKSHNRINIQENLERLGISQREFEVLHHISQGKSNKEIAEALFISENTVKTHVSNLLTKLDAKRRTQAVSKAKSLFLLS